MKKNHKIGARQKKRNKEQNMLSMIMHNVGTSNIENISVLAPIQQRDNPMNIMAIFSTKAYIPSHIEAILHPYFEDVSFHWLNYAKRSKVRLH